MKKQNNIEQLFESKLNNQSFELKDSYLADFESKLDVYNKSRKGLVWFFLGALTLTILIYDFILLPNHIEASHNKEYSKIVLDDTNTEKQKLEDPITSTEVSSEEKHIELNNTKAIQLEEVIAEKQSVTKSETIEEIKTVKKATNSPNIKTNSTDKVISNKKSNGTTPLAPTTVENIPQSKEISLTDSSFDSKPVPTIAKIKTPDVYIDDTIRKKVIIIDTIFQRDTIIINDTINNKIRLFKKKKS